MSEKGPFDPAIQLLEFNDDTSGQHRHDFAINVLKAAGRVEKENALWNIDEAFSQSRDHVETMAPYKEDHNLENYNRADKEITALLEALPEKRKSIDKEK